ncbi:helix-turn-helix domain-containing protein [Lacihabitans soyangensis]|uniref:DNA-binding protein n=1 Tax=Lacihabitans soyangensis TaxID=869394 RepID=A0AAE3GZG0_9BACT|nr:helix-turn-helix domain-containing protein [Lacihabitans soyangensis]MCP9761480.1 DNA-binding protein [Lacihabitans soyangensis]
MNEVTLLFESLMQEIQIIKTYVANVSATSVFPERFDKVWIDGQDVMLSLHISKRTLQYLRDSGVLPYSRINGKFYYKIADIENLLVKNYTASPLNSDKLCK